MYDMSLIKRGIAMQLAYLEDKIPMMVRRSVKLKNIEIIRKTREHLARGRTLELE